MTSSARRWLIALIVVAMPGLCHANQATSAPKHQATSAADGERAGSKKAKRTSHRKGFAFGISLTPRAMRGNGVDEFSGAFGGLSLLFGTSASQRMLWIVRFEGGAKELDPSRWYATSTLGVQYYVREVLWVRGGAGVTRLGINDESGEREITQTGLGLTSSAGYDLLRSGSFVLGLEFGFTSGVFGGESITGGGFGLSGTWY